jgi:hypothetical protein
MRKFIEKPANLDARARLQRLRDAFAGAPDQEEPRLVLLEGAQVAVAIPRGRPAVARDPRAKRRV